MSWLKQSTAITVKIGPFVDDTDGKTAETGLTISQADVRLSKNGGDLAQKSSATACTHDEIGVYDCPLDTTDTGTLGRLDLFVHEAGALPVFATFMIVPANVWDSLFGADRLQVHADEITAGLITSGSFAAGAITAAVIATGAIDADALAADAGTEIGTAVWATAARTLTAATNVTSTGAAVPITAGGLVSADVTAISTDTTAANNAESFFDGTGYAGTNNTIPTVTAVTGNIGGNLAGSVGSVTGNVGGNVTGSVGSLAAQAKADVNAEVVDALATDTYAEPGSVPAATSSLEDKIGWLFMLARNARTTTASADKVRNDANSSDVATAALSDDGTTFTRGEYA